MLRRPAWILRAVLSALPHRYFTHNFMYWLLEDAVHKDEASRQMVDQWVADSYLAMRSFKSRPMVNPTVLADVELQSIQVPALYLVGENEKIYSAQAAVQRLNEVAPQIETDIIPDAGHDLTLVQADLVNRKVLAFLKEQ